MTVLTVGNAIFMISVWHGSRDIISSVPCPRRVFSYIKWCKRHWLTCQLTDGIGNRATVFFCCAHIFRSNFHPMLTFASPPFHLRFFRGCFFFSFVFFSQPSLTIRNLFNRFCCLLVLFTLLFLVLRRWCFIPLKFRRLIVIMVYHCITFSPCNTDTAIASPLALLLTANLHSLSFSCPFWIFILYVILAMN